MASLLLHVLLTSALLGTGDAVSGFDDTGPIAQDIATCLVTQAKMQFAIIRAWHSYGGFDTTVTETLSALQTAGLPINATHVYMFPCNRMTAADQVAQLLGNLTANKVQYARIWLDIESNPSPNCGWSADAATNCKYMASLATALNATGLPWGTYTSTHMWTTLMGGDTACPSGPWTAGPLWYPHYDKSPSFSDFVPFGGWQTPHWKQYDDSATPCNHNVDSNWGPAL